MKFIMGLLAGTLGVLALSTITGLDWQPPSRFLSAEPPTEVIEVMPLEEAPAEPIKSVTIEPIIADVAPAPLPAPLPSLEPAPEQLASEQPILEQPIVEQTAPDELRETAVVWKPFHSEVSATGFARRLSSQLGYPFRALREGPARYLVVFEYGSEEQRQILSQQVTALTGFTQR